MTIYYQDPRVGEKNKNSTDVLGDEATTGSQAPNTASQPSGQDQATQPQGTQPSGSQQPQNMPKKPSGSGMFTNVKQYIEKNKPQASKMAGASTKELESQAKQIQQQAQSRKDALSKQVDTNKAAMEKDKTFAQQMVSQAGVTQPQAQAQTPQAAMDSLATAQAQTGSGTQTERVDGLVPKAQAPTEEENFERFRQIASGQTEAGYGNVQDLNISKQELIARRLGKQAEGAKTEAGRRELMRGAFGKDRAYTRGQSSLDELVLGGDPNARQQMITQAAAATEGLEPGLKGMRRQALEQVTGLRRDASSVGEDVTGLADTAAQDVRTAAETEAQARMESFGTQQQAFEKALAGEGQLTAEMLNQFIAPEQYQQMVSQAQAEQKALGRYLGKATSGFRSADKGFRQTDIAGLDRDKLRQRQADFIAAQMGSVKDTSKMGTEARRQYEQARRQKQTMLGSEFRKGLQKDVLGQTIDEGTIRQRLLAMHKAGQFDASALKGPSAANITAQNVATPEQMARVQALARLRGTTSEWLPQQSKQAATERGKFDMSGFQNLINRGLIKV